MLLSTVSTGSRDRAKSVNSVLETTFDTDGHVETRQDEVTVNSDFRIVPIRDEPKMVVVKERIPSFKADLTSLDLFALTRPFSSSSQPTSSNNPK